jgi:alkyl sulfatase BDS1-like metallo-beta-lactamase superfamily hydrolase
MESIATRLNPATIGDRKLAINFAISDRKEMVKVSVGNAVMISETGTLHDQPQATVT